MRHRAVLTALLIVLALGASACGSKPDKADTQIAFITSRDGDYAIYGMRADGTDEVRLTKNDAEQLVTPAEVFFQYDPAWSPDGQRIVFTSRRDGRSHVYVMNADGTGTRQLTRGSHDDATPTWSPDGNTIAFSRDGELYLMTVRGTKLHAVTGVEDSEELDPAWSPDGAWIAYSFRPSGFQSHEIWRVHPDGSGRRAVTRLYHSSIDPAWSPDGKKIVFASDGADARYQLYEIGANGKGARRLTYQPTDYFDPSFLPDGKTLIFERDGMIYRRNKHGIETAITDGPNDGSPAWRPTTSG